MSTKASTIMSKSPRKVRLMINPIRGLKLNNALEIVKTMNKGKTKKIYDLLEEVSTEKDINKSKLVEKLIRDYLKEEKGIDTSKII
jgi:ribosomal protein L22